MAANIVSFLYNKKERLFLKTIKKICGALFYFQRLALSEAPPFFSQRPSDTKLSYLFWADELYLSIGARGEKHPSRKIASPLHVE